MASTSETGHRINVANFEYILSDIASHGSVYNPSRPALKIDALNTLLTASKNAVEAVNAAEPPYKLAKNARDYAFKSLNILSTKVINSLKSTTTTAQVDGTATTLIRKLQGRRASPKKTDEQKKTATDAGKDLVEISSSQMSFDSRIENLDKLIKLLSTIPQYTPNEEELKLASLEALRLDLKLKNTAVLSASVALSNMRINRNKVLYLPDDGMVDVAYSIKSYVKSLYGSRSPEYLRISKIKFTKPR